MSSSWIDKAKDFLRGFFLYGLIDGLHKERCRLDDLMMFSLFGRMIGFPHLFNYYHLRLMPYYIGNIDIWMKRTLKERDFFDYIKE